MKIIQSQKKYILLYNFDSDEQDVVDEVVKFVGQDNTTVRDCRVYIRGETDGFGKSLWVTEGHYLIAFAAYHFAYYMDRNTPFEEYNDIDLDYAKDWMNSHKNDPKNFTILR